MSCSSSLLGKLKLSLCTIPSCLRCPNHDIVARRCSHTKSFVNYNPRCKGFPRFVFEDPANCGGIEESHYLAFNIQEWNIPVTTTPLIIRQPQRSVAQNARLA